MDEIATYPAKLLCRLPLHEYYERENALLSERDGWLVPTRFHSLHDEMGRFESGNALVDFSDHGLLRLDGGDAVDFLNRISSNDFRKFIPGDSVQTVLTTEKGRVVDSVIALHMSDHIMLLTSRNAQSQVQQWIEKFIISEDLKVTDETGKHVIFILFHPSKASEMPIGHAFRINYYGNDASLFFFEDKAGFPDQLRSFMDSQVGDDAFDLYKIRQGILHTAPDVMAECNPLELNLWSQISFTKGCYIGQEVIARLETYKKVQRTLCSFHGKESLVPSAKLRISYEGKDIGIVTNSAHDDNDGGIFAGLGVIRREFAVPGAQYAAGENKVPIIIDRVFDQNNIAHGNNISSR